MLAVARAYQEATEWHRKRPDLDGELKKLGEKKDS